MYACTYVCVFPYVYLYTFVYIYIYMPSYTYIYRGTCTVYLYVRIWLKPSICLYVASLDGLAASPGLAPRSPRKPQAASPWSKLLNSGAIRGKTWPQTYVMYIYTLVSMCIYIYTHLYICIYICTHVYIYI